MVELLSADKFVLAVANLTALVTAIFFAVKTLVFIRKKVFPLSANSIYNFRKRLKRNVIRAGYQISIDPHILAFFVIRRLMVMFALSLFIMLIVVLSGVQVTSVGFKESLTLSYLHTNYASYTKFVIIMALINKIIATIGLLVISFNWFYLSAVLRAASRFRYRWYERRRLPWTTVRMAK